MSGQPRSPRRLVARGRWVSCLAALALFVGSVLVPAHAASASAPVAKAVVGSSGVRPMTLAGFDAGDIISDAVFFDKNSMTAAQIDSFFRSKVSSCRAGYTCLKDFRQTSVDRPADQYCSGYKGAANESAATIISRVSQSCGINPRVLIVMLQKEQGLVTHVWPSSWRYDIALGQGCPDDAACDPKYVGFFHQIYGAARQMKIYTEGRWFTYYAPGNTWNILYNPDRRCGSAPVRVANRATSALYYYTPYQPNAAALRAGYGTGDSCSAYGNRNFYNYFTDWFGSTRTIKPPTPTAPSLTAPDTQSYVTAVDSKGVLWGYPFKNSTFSDPVKLATGLTSTTGVIPVGDLNGDGHRDIVLHTGASVAVMRGNGKAFDSAKSLGLDWRNVRLATAAGDFDRDGVPDVITAQKSGELLLWSGDDRGGFRKPVRIGTNWSAITQIVGGLDFDRDGLLDLVARDKQGRLWSYSGNGRGAWRAQQQFGQGWNGMTAVFSPGDFNGDGIADLAGRSSNGDLWMYAGTGAGNVKLGVKSGNGWQSMTGLAGAGVEVRGKRPLPAGAGDVDRDGAVDVVALNANGALALYRGDGAGGWRGSVGMRTGYGARDRIFPMGDFNGDGRGDLGRVTPDGSLLLVPGQGSGLYGAGTVIGNGWQSFSLLTGGIDFDGDRIPDVLGRDSAGRMLLYRGDGRGGWAGAPTPIGVGWGSFDRAFNVGDFDGDGNADLMVRRKDGALWLYPTDGAGSWRSPRQIGVGWGGFTAIIGPGDFDGDGLTDVLARNAKGELSLYRGDGKGGWRSASTVGWGWGGFTALG